MDKTIDVGARRETKGTQGVTRACGPVLAAVLAILGSSPGWAGPAKVRFDVKSDDFPKAIIEFYRQSNIEVAFPAIDEYKQIRTNPIAGELDPRDALEQMLKGTGLQYYFDSDHSVVIAKNLNLGPQTNPAPEERSAHHLASAVTEIPLPQDPSKLQQVVVTGSLIHGVFDVIAPLVYVSKQQLQQAPYATVQDALYALPMNSLNGPREDVPSTGNLLRGAGINLRGLGSGATLVLVNGHRQPMSGFNGDFVDVSNIPWTAVERIEVLPDGASALYGSDAIAGVVNIILRDNVRGAETQTRLGEAIGGANEKLVSQIFGTRWGTGRVMLTYQYSERTSLDASDRAYAANADKTSFGGGDFRTYYGNPANVLDPSSLQPVYGLTAGGSLSSVNYQNQFARFNLFPERRSHNVVASGSQLFGDNLEVFAEGRFSQRDTHFNHFPNEQVLLVPGTSPYFPSGLAGSPFAVVAYSFLNAYGPMQNAGQTRNYIGTVGVKYLISSDWQATLSETYGHETLHADTYNEPDLAALHAALLDPDPATAFNPFGVTNPVTLNAIRLADRESADSGIQTTNLVADGPVFALPGGMAKLAIGAEHRQETFSHWSTISSAVPFGRIVNSAFAELALPLIGDRTNLRAAPRLELTFAGRYENYSDFGTTFNPQVRLRWIPFETVKLRSSWGSSFRAPKLVDLYDTSNNAEAMAVIPDPQSPTGRSLVLAYQGTNPNLKQETAKTWTAGFDWVPVKWPGFNFSLTYYSIDYEGRIVTPGPPNPYETLLEESEWAPIITRNPTRLQIAAACNSPRYQGSVADCLASSPAAIIDFRLANLASNRVSGLDLEATQTWQNRLGHFRLGLNGSYVLHFDQAVTNASPASDILGSVGNPLALRLRATATWSERRPDLPGLGLNLAVNYTGRYDNPASTVVPTVAPWTTLDLQLRYRTPAADSWLGNTEFSLNAVNLFNHDPPFVDNQFGYDVFNVQPLGRVISLYVSKRW